MHRNGNLESLNTEQIPYNMTVDKGMNEGKTLRSENIFSCWFNDVEWSNVVLNECIGSSAHMCFI